MSEPTTERSYIAFISYRHTPLDREAAVRIQKKIESYTVPKEFREQAGGKKLGLCFRDEDELPASSSLTDSIYYALDHSKFLIVICTPDLPLSKWCEAEILYFLKTHDRDHILAVLADGNPEESFSPYMLHDFDEGGNIIKDWEPLAANIAGENHTINKKVFKKESTRLCAAMIGCPFDALWQRERRARTNRLLTAAGAAVAVMAVFLGVVLNRNAQIAAQNDLITAQNNELTEKNDQITEQKDKIEEQNTELQSQLSTVLVDSGISKLERFDVNGALQDALDALDSNDPKIYDHRAEKLLADALGAYKCGQLQPRLIYEQTTNITQVRVTDDNRYALLLDHVGTVRCLDLSAYTLNWEYLVKDPLAEIYTAGPEGSVLIKTARQLLCLSIKDGSVLWSYEQDSENYFQCISDDGSLFAVLDTKAGEEGPALPSDTSDQPDTSLFRPVYAVLFDTKTGEEKLRLELPGEDKGFSSLNEDYRKNYFAADFSGDNSRFVCVLPYTEKAADAKEVQETLFAIDLNSGTIDLSAYPINSTQSRRIPFDIFFGAMISDTAEDIYVVQNNVDREKMVIHALHLKEGGYQYASAEQGFYFGSDTLSLNDVEEEIGQTVPMLASDNHMVFFTDKNILICNNITMSTDRNYNTDSNIISAEWLDMEEEVLQVVTERGSVLRLDLSTDEDYALDSLQQFYIDQDDISCHASINGGIVANKADGASLIVQYGSRNQLLLLSYRSDPETQMLQTSSGELEIDGDLAMIGLLPDSDTAMLFLNYTTVLTFNRKTGEILKTAEMSENFSQGIQAPYLTDATHFLQGNRLYNTQDGSVTSFVTAPENFTDMHDSNIYINKRNQNNDIVTAGMFYLPVPDETKENYFGIMMAYPFWINTLSQGPAFLLDVTDNDIPLTVIGENGLLALCGDDWNEEGNDKDFHFADYINDKVYDIKRTYPNNVSCLIALGTELPVAAILYENGEMQTITFRGDNYQKNTLYDTDTGKYASQNEALAMCFAEGDQQLLMLSSAGRLSITNMKSVYDNFGAVGNHESDLTLYRGVIDIFRDNLNDFDNDIRADLSADEKTMFIYEGYASHVYNAVFMDTESWTPKAEIASIYSIDEENNKIYAYTDNADGTGASAIVTYPIHTLEDLKEWARKVLEEG